MKRFEQYFVNLICPVFIFGSITGIFTAIIINLYKALANYLIEFSEKGYSFLKSHILWIPVIIIALYGIASLFSWLYKKNPRLSGGGIPSSIAILRRIISFNWLKTLIGVFFMSLTSFLIGVPLGNEGPSVLIGTAVGKGSVSLFAQKHTVWSKYSMTGGACAGFSIATGASFSGILFAIEEAHQRISPMIIIVGCISVLFATLTSNIIAPILGVSTKLFPEIQLAILSIKDIWISLILGIIMGFFAVLFLKYYQLINNLFNNKIKKASQTIKIFFVFILTLISGLILFSNISTGHHLILSLFNDNTPIYLLVLILFIRTTLTLLANSNKITGGIFLPILALGAILSAILGKTFEVLFNFNHEYYNVILMLGITACIASMMKMPITAVAFSIEALSCHNNFLHVIVVASISYMITEIFSAKGINDSIIENIVKSKEKTKKLSTFEAYVTIQKNSFAEFMKIKDILWPANFVILSIISNNEVIDKTDDSFNEGDILHIRYSTFDDSKTQKELLAIVGEQEYRPKEILN